LGGRRFEGAEGTYEIVNPATEEVVGLAPEASAAAKRNPRPGGDNSSRFVPSREQLIAA
jgi:hypothetical protein